MDPKEKEELRLMAQRLSLEAQALNAHLSLLTDDNLDADTLGSTAWSFAYRTERGLRDISLGFQSLGQQLLRYRLRVFEMKAPGVQPRVDLIRLILSKYIGLHGAAAGALLDLLREPSLTEDDPRLTDVAQRMTAWLFDLPQQTVEERERTLHLILLAESALSLLCEDTPERRDNAFDAIRTYLCGHIQPTSTALELLDEIGGP